MYDNYFEPCEYHKLLRIVADIVDGENVSMTEEDIQYKIQEAYDNNKISGTQYDHLMGMLD
jgi:hypothetical protein